MSEITAVLSKRHTVFQAFKFVIYAFLSYNMFLFFQGELLASAETFRDGIQLDEFILAFSASIDSLAWIVLLLIFELETSILSDEVLKSSVNWVLLFVKAICYFFIFYAAYGYVAKLLFVLNTSALQYQDVCNLIGTSYTYIVTLDEYLPITESACQLMNNNPLIQINNTNIIGTESDSIAIQHLAWIDIINAMTWLVIVAILEVDVYLQLHDRFSGFAVKISRMSKPLLYGVLFFCAIYWGVKSDFVDFWDAFLWLLAFFVIELNMFQWQAEIEEANVAI